MRPIPYLKAFLDKCKGGQSFRQVWEVDGSWRARLGLFGAVLDEGLLFGISSIN